MSLKQNIYLMLIVGLVVHGYTVQADTFIKVVVKIKAGCEESVRQFLELHRFLYLRKVTDSTYTFFKRKEHISDLNAEVASLQKELFGKIDYLLRSQRLFLQMSPTLDQFKLYPKAGITEDVVRSKSDFLKPSLKLDYGKSTSKADINISVCRPMFDPLLGVDATWAQGITGRDVVVAITDIGIDPDQPDIKAHLDPAMSYNFVNNSSIYKPELFPQIQSSTDYTNHGHACAGLVAGQLKNSTCQYCGSGVAPNATIAALKVCRVQQIWNGHLKLFMDDEILSNALSYNNDKIDLYSCSLNHDKPFKSIHPYVEDVLRKAYTSGRKGKGNIFVFPADPPGNGYTNNIYTIGVGTIGVHGGLSAKSEPNSAVLVSAFGFGRRVHDTHLLTPTHPSLMAKGVLCDVNFGGSSAATALISGMIALALEANSHLTARDIKHVLIESCDHKGLNESSLFKRNGAGYYYHNVFGFGYPVATRMIQLAKSWKILSELLYDTHVSNLNGHQRCEVKLYVTCNTTNTCIEKTEQILVHVTFAHPANHKASIVAASPKGTRSVLFERAISSGDLIHGSFKAIFLSNHFWGENPNGTWTIHLGSAACNYSEEINKRMTSIVYYALLGLIRCRCHLLSHRCQCVLEKYISLS
ncbi:neuroendocrine convertase 1-like isoform X2 [Dreissena polymorpha]|uniref:neuroendocrine convertase 1-like isoform X2 n=1 Tax=Dreissena polymorpha TaxID=45954 RepID=UPI00226444D8|nr:neuroendocrine convertase 1-like isoform X2 [Dreissena polymorpha]